MYVAFGSKSEESVSVDEDSLTLQLLSPRLRDFDRSLRLRLDEEDLLLRPEEEEAFEPTVGSVLPLIDAGDLGGRQFGAIIDVFSL